MNSSFRERCLTVALKNNPTADVGTIIEKARQIEDYVLGDGVLLVTLEKTLEKSQGVVRTPNGSKDVIPLDLKKELDPYLPSKFNKENAVQQ